MDALIKEDHFITHIPDEYDTSCWGCGIHLRLPSYNPVYKCGWCGAITNQNQRQQESDWLRWRRLRDRCFVCVLALFILLIISGGVWAVYPVVFSVGIFCGVIHCTITMILSIITISSFGLAAFRSAGSPPDVNWGSRSAVDRHGLENYTFCQYCSKPKSPRTHHCRTCGMCVLDMDHHCPFIGNCVGAANHRHFIIFLMSAMTSTTYAFIMCAYAGFRVWPPLTYGSIGHLTGGGMETGWRAMKEILVAFLNSAVLLSTRGILLVYLFVASFSVTLGIAALLVQQLCYIYEGNTYLSHLRSQGDNEGREKDCRNIYRFFGCPYSTARLFSGFSSSKKIHRT